jgi:YggT family protein
VTVGASAAVGLLADTAGSIQRFIDVFVAVYILLILVYILTSWIRLPYSPWLSRVQRFLYDVCEPYLRLFRRIVPPMGPLDLSPMVAVVVLLLLQRVVASLLDSA